MGNITPKTFSDSYLYNLNKEINDKLLFSFIMQGQLIDTDSNDFQDIAVDFKRRQISAEMYKVLMSNTTMIIKGSKPLPKAFKYVVARDVKDPKTPLKLFIDGDGIREKNGVYSIDNPSTLIAYVFGGMTSFIYRNNPKLYVMDSRIIKDGARLFSTLFTHIIDFLYKISSFGNGTRDNCIYLSALYYQVGILDKDFNDSAKAVARNIAKLSTREEEILIGDIDEEEFKKLNLFIDLLIDKLRLPKLTLEAVVEKWIWQYGPGTQYSLELFDSFAYMIGSVRIGAFVNNQNTIEKVTGSSNLIDFTNSLISIAKGVV